MILAGDIGGAKTNLGLFDVADGALKSRNQETFPSKRYSALESIIQEFITGAGHATVAAACFGVAGPVVEGRSVTPNLPWVIESMSLASRLDLDSVALINDGHVSVERALSGPGLFNIYDFLRSTGYGKESPSVVERFKENDPSSVIANAAMAGECGLCEKALDMFAAIYGAAAGNVALVLKATAGVYAGGGIAPKIIEKLKDGSFLRGFTAKARLSSLLEAIPVRVIMNPKTALLGAARVAARHASHLTT